MLDNDVSDSCKKIIDLINENNEIVKNILMKKDIEIKELKQALDLSDSRRQTAEDMVSKIKNDVSLEIQKAYQSGYNAASFNANPTGGTTISQDQTKTLTLNNQS